jgi:hypothetical protein
MSILVYIRVCIVYIPYMCKYVIVANYLTNFYFISVVRSQFHFNAIESWPCPTMYSIWSICLRSVTYPYIHLHTAKYPYIP